MDIVIALDEDGVPIVKVPALLDWLDTQIAALETAKEQSNENTGIYLQNVIDSYVELKAELTATTMELMDVCSAV